MEEQIRMKLEVRKAETLGELNKAFRLKVQLEEQLEENEVQIHFKRGKMDAFDEIQKIVEDVAKAEQFEAMRHEDE